MIYLASPYSDPSAEMRESNYRMVRDCAIELAIHQGFMVFSPILYLHRAAEELRLPTDAKAYERFNTHMQRMAEEIWVLAIDGWQESLGVKAELALAKTLGQTVRYIDEFGRHILPTEFTNG